MQQILLQKCLSSVPGPLLEHLGKLPPVVWNISMLGEG